MVSTNSLQDTTLAGCPPNKRKPSIIASSFLGKRQSRAGCPPNKHAIFLIHLRIIGVNTLVNQWNRDWFHPLMGQYAALLISD
jgi:hypothetical protein